MVYYHDIVHYVKQPSHGDELCGSRALGISEAGDTVIISPKLRSEIGIVVSHYERVGISVSRDIVYCDSISSIRFVPFDELSIYAYTDMVHSIIGDDRRYRSTKALDQKHSFSELCARLEITHPKSKTIAAYSDYSISDVQLPCVIKNPHSIFGRGVELVKDSSRLSKILHAHDFSASPLLLQDYLDFDYSINAQFSVEPHGVQRLICSDQILDGFRYTGSAFPASADPWEAAAPLVEWAHENGAKGILGFDIGIERTSRNAYVIECNPRINGATYPTLIAARLDVNSWSTATISINVRTLDNLQLREIEYSKSKGYGIILINWGTVLVGSLTIMLIGDRETQAMLLMRFKELFEA